LLIDPYTLYLDFLKDANPDYYAYSAELFEKKIIPYEDLFCISWLRFLSGAIAPMRTAKHVIVDEAQEYPEIVYMLLSGLFPSAKFTVLGDIAQQVDKKIPSIASIKECFDGKKTVAEFVLDKSYRSTHEINAFAGRFRNHREEEIRVVDRHGPEPVIEKLTDPIAQIKSILESYRSRGRNTNMILCRTQEECDRLYKLLMHEIPVIRMRSFDTFSKETNVILPIYLSKGLEADGVILVGKTEEWNTPEDRNLMYVAATRALHELTVLYDGEKGNILS
jgi:DNA helicase-2/ATP-dependent DNA helicase PcrA